MARRKKRAPSDEERLASIRRIADMGGNLVHVQAGGELTWLLDYIDKLQSATSWREIGTLNTTEPVELFFPVATIVGRQVSPMVRVGVPKEWPLRRASHWRPLPTAPTLRV